MLWGAAIGGVLSGLAYWLAHPCDFDFYEFGKAVGIGSVVGMVTSVVAWAVPAGLKFFWGIKATGWLSSGLIGLAAGVPSGALGQMTSNLLTGRPLWENVGVAAVVGGGLGFVFGVAAHGIKKLWTNWRRAGASTPNAIGTAGEQAAGTTGPKSRIDSLTDTANYRVPDELDIVNSVLTEVKNVAKLSYTSQLKDFLLYSQQNGFTFELVTRHATKFSGPLQKLIDAGKIILRYLPW